MKVYTALYNPNTWESGWTVLSLHAKRDGAEMAIQNHAEKRQEWLDAHGPTHDLRIQDWEQWDVGEMEFEYEDLLLKLLNQAFVHKTDGLVTICVPERVYNEVKEKLDQFHYEVRL